jgi:hypothetical protein
MSNKSLSAKNITPVTTNNEQIGRRLLSERQAAEFLGCSAALLRKMRLRGSSQRSQAVPFVRLCGRSIRYDLHDLIEFISTRRVQR